MNGSPAASPQGETGARRWLLFIHQLPPKPDYLRVKVRRRLRRLGAVAVKHTVYLLPNTDEAVEDFHWVRQEVEAEGGRGGRTGRGPKPWAPPRPRRTGPHVGDARGGARRSHRQCVAHPAVHRSR